MGLSKRRAGEEAERVAAYFRKNPDARVMSNRDIAAIAQVDEWTVRKWKARNGIPPLKRGSNQSVLKPADEPDVPPKRRRKPAA